MLFTCDGDGIKRVVAGTIKLSNGFFFYFWFGKGAYHEFKEKPGLLQSTFPHTSTAHHPLKGQLFMEELG